MINFFKGKRFFLFIIIVGFAGLVTARTKEEICVDDAITRIKKTQFFKKPDAGETSIRNSLKSDEVRNFALVYQDCVSSLLEDDAEADAEKELYDEFTGFLAEKIRSDFVKFSDKYTVAFPERSLRESVKEKEKKLADNYNFLLRSNRGQDHFMTLSRPKMVADKSRGGKYLVCHENENCLALRVNGLIEQDPDSILQRYFSKFSSTKELTVILPPRAKNNQITTRLTQKIRSEICSRKGGETASKRWHNFINNAAGPDSMSLFNKITQVYKELYRTQVKELDFAAHLERSINMSIKNNVCGNFNPIALGHLVAFLDEYKEGSSAKWKIIDPSAGWGDRYSSAAVLGSGKVDYYIGLDPSTHMTAVYPKIKVELEKLRRKKGKNKETHPNLMEVLTIGSEMVNYETQDRESDRFSTKDIIIDKNEGKITFKTKKSRPNLIFTSPPYFDLESYGDEKTQSSNKFETLEEWEEGFLAVTIKKHINILEDDGFLAFNLADPKGDNEITLVSFLIKTVEQYPEMKFLGWVGLGLEYRRNNTSHQPVEPILIWQKNSQSKNVSKRRKVDSISTDESLNLEQESDHAPPKKKRKITRIKADTEQATI